MRRVDLRPLARDDIDRAFGHYLSAAGSAVAVSFADALEAVYRLLIDHPGAGTSRYADDLAMPDLRSLKLKRYPWIVFYLTHPDTIEIIRLLHAHSDVVAALAAAD